LGATKVQSKLQTCTTCRGCSVRSTSLAEVEEDLFDNRFDRAGQDSATGIVANTLAAHAILLGGIGKREERRGSKLGFRRLAEGHYM
jgi:hypothetical protein